jgi:hypothetical protein
MGIEERGKSCGDHRVVECCRDGFGIPARRDFEREGDTVIVIFEERPRNAVVVVECPADFSKMVLAIRCLGGEVRSCQFGLFEGGE